MTDQPTLDEHLDFPEQFDELWHQIEEIATRAIDEHHDCGGFEDAHIIANEVRKLLADYIQREVRDGRIDELERLRADQAKYIKAQSGHIRNNNSWPKTRGYGIQAQMTLDWIDKRIASLSTIKVPLVGSSGQGFAPHPKTGGK